VNIHLAVAPYSVEALNKGLWLVILHAERIPPHIGIMFAGNYNSLTIKTRETNINSELLIKTINQKKIKTIFLQIAEHPVFSLQHQLDIFQEHLAGFNVVKQYEATCLSPIKLFFQEFYAIPLKENDLLLNFVQKLHDNQFIVSASSLNFELNNGISLPYYTITELNDKIKSERQNLYND